MVAQINEDKSTTATKGYGAELLVRADLTFAGHMTHGVDSPASPYDIIALVDGGFRKIQVKARTADKYGRVKVDIRKSNGVDRYYAAEDCDIIAVVEPLERLIAYIPYAIWGGKSQITLYTENRPAAIGTKTKDNTYCFEDYRDINNEKRTIV